MTAVPTPEQPTITPAPAPAPAPGTRRLGRNGPAVSALGLGCWAIGGEWTFDGEPAGWGRVDDDESRRALRLAVDLGVTFFDTADVYGCGHSERVLGEALAPVRDQVVIATKGGLRFDEATRSGSGDDASPEYLRRACDASLRRLGTDRIDLYQLHGGAKTAADAAVAVEVFEELVAAGKVRAYGPSTEDPEVVAVFARGEHCTAVQTQFNVFGVDAGQLDRAERAGLAVVGRTPLAMGLLTGKYARPEDLPAGDVRRNTPYWDYFRAGRMDEWLARLDAVRAILTSGGRTLAQGAIAWVWARSPAAIPVPGFRTEAQVRENAGALAFGPLEPGQVAEVDRLLAMVPAGGGDGA